MDWDDFSEDSGPEVDYDDRPDHDPWVAAGGLDASKLGPWDLEDNN